MPQAVLRPGTAVPSRTGAGLMCRCCGHLVAREVVASHAAAVARKPKRKGGKKARPSPSPGHRARDEHSLQPAHAVARRRPPALSRVRRQQEESRREQEENVFALAHEAGGVGAEDGGVGVAQESELCSADSEDEDPENEQLEIECFEASPDDGGGASRVPVAIHV